MIDDNLVTWLSKQLARDEVLAREAGDGDAGRWRAEAGIGGGCAQIRIRNEAGEIVVYDEGSPTNEEAAHIARHDPAVVLADVTAKRRILGNCRQVLELASDHHTVESCDEDDAVLAEAVLRALASAYADRPGFREEWRSR